MILQLHAYLKLSLAIKLDAAPTGAEVSKSKPLNNCLAEKQLVPIEPAEIYTEQ
jgi:hypothetical protein